MPHSADTPDTDTGIACLVTLARFHSVAADPAQIKHEFGQSNRNLDDDALIRAAKYLNLKAGSTRSRWDRLRHLTLPAIARHVDGHYFIIAKLDEQRVLVQDPLETRPLTLPRETFEQAWDGGLILISRRSALPDALRKFNFSWFVPAILKHKKILGEVLLASFFIQLFALITPLFFYGCDRQSARPSRAYHLGRAGRWAPGVVFL